jgi:predicted Zn-dependent protease
MRMANEKRLETLRRLTASPQADSFAFYALALEYRSANMFDQALATFRTLRERDPEYLAMYLMCGTMLVAQGEQAAARDWLETGLQVARRQNNAHAASELRTTLATLEESDSG